MRAPTLRVLGLASVVLAGVGWLSATVGLDPRQWSPEAVRAYLLTFGPLAPAVYLLAYGQPIVPLPASIMMLAGGLVFGPWWGALASVAGGTARAYSQFAMVRLLGRPAMAQLVSGRLMKLDKRIGERGVMTVLLVRLVPNVPFDMQNYAFGFSRVRFGPYALGSFLGIIPGSFAYAYFGYSLTDLRNAWKVMLALGLIAALAFMQRRLAARKAAARVVRA